MATFITYEFEDSEMDPEDRKLASKLANEYNLPFDKLCKSIDFLHRYIHGFFKMANEIGKEFKKNYQHQRNLLKGPDIKINIITNDGDIMIDKKNIFYPYFKTAINKASAKCDMIINSADLFSLFKTAINKTSVRCDMITTSEDLLSLSESNFSKSKINKFYKSMPLETLIQYLPSAPKFKKYVIVGLLIVYFKFDSDIMTEQEFELKKEKGLTEAQDYKHYLYDIVKSRLKKYSKTF